ncbi:hypothetical protein AQUCO_00200647v1 [Aquilegia coerulea]|uniref:Uncharacterized protein n=1 Tax=Aquilegia coerulea TaxID=218851 RepID=A0A2G5F461_AQUCA|nr:hypothetical protein AQUCO_00200647v1 [Aquilegia coerulea]
MVPYENETFLKYKNSVSFREFDHVALELHRVMKGSSVVSLVGISMLQFPTSCRTTRSIIPSRTSLPARATPVPEGGVKVHISSTNPALSRGRESRHPDPFIDTKKRKNFLLYY